MPNARHRLPAAALDALVGLLREAGYTTIGPTLHDGAIVNDVIAGADDLPVGFLDDQEAARYAVRDAGTGRYFDHTLAPQGWRQFLRPPREPLFSAARSGGEVVFRPPVAPSERYAFVGVRPCDLRALGVLDTVLSEQAHVDERYTTRRAAAFVVAVQCARAGNTCFCASMASGPRAEGGFDLALTEVEDDAGHAFIVEVGSERGASIAAELPLRIATDAEWAGALAVSAATAASMGRTLRTDGLADLLASSLDSPLWQEVGARCLACANCTLVCPTCFCTTVAVESDLRQTEAQHTQVGDSCFHADFTAMHGGPPVRDATAARYRQWLTHKLSSWHEQFGESGCVGCGRCITWCPVGIDLTVEAAKARRRHKRTSAFLHPLPASAPTSPRSCSRPCARAG